VGTALGNPHPPLWVGNLVRTILRFRANDIRYFFLLRYSKVEAVGKLNGLGKLQWARSLSS